MPGEYDMNKMQEEAIRRAREMQSRAHIPPQRNSGREQPDSEQQRRSQQNRAAQSHSQPSRHTGEPEQRAREQEPRRRQEEPLAQREIPPSSRPQQEQNPPALSPESALDALFRDRERTIILALLLLLESDGSHHELMFALMFLLM